MFYGPSGVIVATYNVECCSVQSCNYCWSWGSIFPRHW